MKTRKTKTYMILLFFIISLCVIQTTTAITVDNTITITVDNENYTFPTTGITFDQISFNETDSWISFNNTDFNITSTNPVNITISYLNNNIDTLDCGQLLVEFSANTSDGMVYFNLSGFKSLTPYEINRDGIAYQRVWSDANGFINFSNNIWSEHDFSILQACNDTGYEYGNWSFSEHVNSTGALEEEWIESNNTIWYTNDSSSWWAGNYTYAFNATDSSFDVTILNNSGMNRTQVFGWCKLNFTVADNVYPMIIFNYANNNSFDAVMFRNDYVYVAHWNGTNLIDIESGLTWEEIDLMHTWENQESQEWEEPAYLTIDGCYYKLLYNTYTGDLRFKYWNTQFMNEPAGWALEYQHDNISTNDSRCLGLGVWNPDEQEGTAHFDLYNSWQLNYTLNESDYCEINDHNRSRPHMDFPILDMADLTEAMWDFFEDAFDGNLTVDSTRDFMKDNITNPMNMESRMFNYSELDTGEQNDTIYYYSCIMDNYTSYNEEALFDEFLYLQVQHCSEDAIDENEFAHLLVGIDVDNDRQPDDNDRVYWSWTDDTYVVTEHAYNANGTPVADVYASSIWSSARDGVQNLHRYNSHLNYNILIPLGDLVKADGEPLNNSDVFGLSILTTDGDTINSETPVVWQNWNETTGLTFFDEDVIWGQAEEYFFNKTYTTDKAILDRWGEGEIGSGGSMSGELSYNLNITQVWNDTVVLAGENWCLVNQTVNVTNDGAGDLTNVIVNMSKWNCSCSDLNMTLVSTDLDMSNFTWYNDSCYLHINDTSLTLGPAESWTFYINWNITNCSGITSATDSSSISANATEHASFVDGNTVNFFWNMNYVVNINYAYAQIQKNIDMNGIIITAATILIIITMLMFVFQLKNGEFNPTLTTIMVASVIGVIILFPILNIGTFMNDTLTGSMDNTETFTGLVDGTAQTFNLNLIPKTIIRVTVNNGISSSTASPSEYRINAADNVVVDGSAFI